jgi:hypothetical protein
VSRKHGSDGHLFRGRKERPKVFGLRSKGLRNGCPKVTAACNMIRVISRTNSGRGRPPAYGHMTLRTVECCGGDVHACRGWREVATGGGTGGVNDVVEDCSGLSGLRRLRHAQTAGLSLSGWPSRTTDAMQITRTGVVERTLRSGPAKRQNGCPQ